VIIGNHFGRIGLRYSKGGCSLTIASVLGRELVLVGKVLNDPVAFDTVHPDLSDLVELGERNHLGDQSATDALSLVILVNRDCHLPGIVPVSCHVTPTYPCVISPSVPQFMVMWMITHVKDHLINSLITSMMTESRVLVFWSQVL
jgi:hypothetical protein